MNLNKNSKNEKRIYDLPNRIFHSLFGVFFITAFLIAKNVDDESPTFMIHMFLGLFLGVLLVFRILWGFLGTEYAKFSTFPIHPKSVVNYFLGILQGKKHFWAGHNPASSGIAMVMWICAAGLVFTGIQMTSGAKEDFEDLHEIFANTFAVSTLLHLAGLILHTVKNRDPIWKSMFTGMKQNLNRDTHEVASRPLVAVLLLAFLTVTGIFFYQNFDPRLNQLHLPGITLQLGENPDFEE